MRETFRFRQVVALFAAYMVALGALLLPLSVAAGASVDVSHCRSVVSVDSSQPPADHATGCACAAGCGMQCGIHGLAGPPQAAVAYLQIRVSVLAPPRSIDGVTRRVDRGPQSPRPPPVA